MKTFMLLAAMLITASASGSEIDKRIDSMLKSRGLEASEASDPARFMRRCYLVVTDRIPTEAQTRAYLKNPDKTALVDSLLASDGFVEKMVLKWGDMFRIKSEFPSCMWPNAVQAFNKWLTEEFRANTPYDAFVRKLICSSGSNFRVPQTNFYRAGSDRKPSKFTSDAALLFLGMRKAPEEWENFFTQVKFKSSKEWKEEILCIDIDEPAPGNPVRLGKGTVLLQEGTDYRIPFADWLVSKDNRDFARAFANRLWFWLMGRGIIEPADDMSGTPSNPGLLEYLTDSFIAGGFDIRSLAREILLSDAFGRSTISNAGNASDDVYFSKYIQSRITSEQLCDAICDITGVPDLYSSRAPEPFTNFPAGTRANQVCDGTITTPQLDIFGRPSRDVALESGRDNSVNAKQILYLLNSTTIQDKLRKSPYLRAQLSNFDIRRFTADAYVRVLARPASDKEVQAVVDWSSKMKAGGFGSRDVAESLVWALINSDEFLFLN